MFSYLGILSTNDSIKLHPVTPLSRSVGHHCSDPSKARGLAGTFGGAKDLEGCFLRNIQTKKKKKLEKLNEYLGR